MLDILQHLVILMLGAAALVAIVQNRIAQHERNARKRRNRRRRAATAPVRKARRAARTIKRGVR